MVFRPFPDVPLDGARPGGQLRGGRRPVGVQGLVQAQPLAPIHGEQFQRAGHVPEQPAGQRRRITRFHRVFVGQTQTGRSSLCVLARVRLGAARDDSQYLAANRGAAGPDEEPVGREGPP